MSCHSQRKCSSTSSTQMSSSAILASLNPRAYRNKVSLLLLHINWRRVQYVIRLHTLTLQCSHTVLGVETADQIKRRENKVWNLSVSMPSLSHLCVFSIIGWNSLLVMLMIEVAATTSLPQTSAHTPTQTHTHLQGLSLLLPVGACMCSPLARSLCLSPVMSLLLSLLFFCLPLPLPL